MSPLTHLSDAAKHTGDVISIGALFAVFVKVIPAITAVLTLVWIVMRMVESWQAIRLNDHKLRRSRASDAKEADK